ncbi:CPBP family intramembrane glutamic endopeptidase [Virgibacillus halodenitrificans]|uniref:CPBP family intramembrane glutamic endopeptidase n=1 Tax=Virgibacillus halodenitrificans TaxID=1482 RepID=UPI00136DC787|nr:CPBP family intramembrane glutamic endopeptidase [Virgibacillus halodenitrificans]
MEKKLQSNLVYRTFLFCVLGILYIIFSSFLNSQIFYYINYVDVFGLFFILIFIIFNQNRGFFFKKMTLDFFKHSKNYIYVFIGYLSILFSNWALLFFPVSYPSTETEIIHITSIPLSILFVIGLVLLAPIWEEMLMKRLILDFTRVYLPFWMGMIITSLIFALLHNVNLPQRIFIFILSIVTCIVYKKTDSLYGPIFIHSLWNFTSLG